MNSVSINVKTEEVVEFEEVFTPTPIEVMQEEARNIRNQELRETDWTQIGDSGVTGPEKAAWMAYRQKLRDVSNRPDWDESPLDAIGKVKRERP